MQSVAVAGGILLLALVLWDGFETVLLPRRVTRKFRLTRTFYSLSWKLWSGIFRRARNRRRRDQALSAFGPLSMLVLLILWAVTLVLGFALIHWGRHSRMSAPSGLSFLAYCYMSGTTFLTLGLGDIVPLDAAGRALTVAEAGTGFGFLAIVIGYLPVIYGAFSQREVTIALLDARAGTPSTATELMRRHARGRGLGALDRLFADWERWSADLLESHISYPVLSYYRSQHDNQSWLGSLTTILDACSVALAGVQGPSRWQAKLTFAMARHAVVDLAQVLNSPPLPPDPDRLPPEDFERMMTELRAAGIPLAAQDECERKLTKLRRLYEPYVNALAGHLIITLPGWLRQGDPPDNWQTSAWERRASGLARSGVFDAIEDDHDS
jgi:ABC-type multidrug transport system fused ATPase/permease subunit